MKRLFCTVLVIVPAISLLAEGSFLVKLLGIGLFVLIIVDYVTGKRLIIPCCKIMYFMLYIPLWIFIEWRKARKERKSKTIHYDIDIW